MTPFRIALFSEPNSLFVILPALLHSNLEISSIVSFAIQGEAIIQEPLKAELKNRKIMTFFPLSLEDASFQQEFLNTKPSIIIVMSLSKKIPMSLLNKIPFGGINWHPSLLPAYRGSMPCFWPIARREEETGVTLHQLTKSIDAGDIYLQEKIKIEPEETQGSLWAKAEQVGIKLFLYALNEIKREVPLPRIAQDSTKVSYAPFPSLFDLTIDWNKKAADILALIRAASPILGAFTLFRNFPLKIWSARSSRLNVEKVLPGTLNFSNGILEVAAVDNFLSLETLQLGLLRYYSGKEFLSFPGLQEGERLG